MGVRRRRLAVAALGYGTVVATGSALFAWALPAVWRFLPAAPARFWVLFGIALLVDVPLYRVGPTRPTKVRSSLSACAALAIFVEWGAAPAIFVQALVVTASVVWQRHDRLSGPAFVARHVGALAAAGTLSVTVGLPSGVPQRTLGVAGHLPLPFVVTAVTWMAASFVLLLVASMPITGYSVRAHLAAAAEDLVIVGAAILLIEPLLTTVTGGWTVVAALPLYAWSALARVRFTQDRRLNREPVTGVLNRSGLAARVQELSLYDYVRADKLTRFGIFVVNVDVLLTVNRVFGREAFEQLTRELAGRLLPVYGPRQVGRLVGEGLVVVVPGMTVHSALAEAERAGRIVAPSVQVSGVPFDLEPAIGVAVSPEDGRDLATLVVRAEYAIHEARARGVRAMVYGREEMNDASRRSAILQELCAVLQDPARREEIRVVYQPQIELSTGRLAGIEALVRWTHPQWGPVRPDVLVEAVEPSAVMHTLTMRVLETAVEQISRWNDQGLRTKVAVNASVRDLHVPGFADEISDVIARYAIAPRQLTIELTERMVISADPEVVRAAERITGLGVGLSLDDFGVGFASVDQLRTLPLTEVKIDKSYVDKVTKSEDEWAIMRSLHALVTALRLEMVAEGVEDEHTAARLAQLPGVIGQGYHFARPMSAADLQQWLDRQRPSGRTA